MSPIGRLSALAALALAALLASGCGETVIDSVKTEGAIEANLEKATGRKVSSVACPSGVEVEAGTTFECTVALQSGKEETVTLRIINSDADVELTKIKSGGAK